MASITYLLVSRILLLYSGQLTDEVPCINWVQLRLIMLLIPFTRY